ncbi:hypothetical protein WJX74_000374 [Apatococcus lobatus]|uniref:Sphingomyelin synthase-like domain-containing protein n=1 Tax=Apatococcus lobatus TaxID=904363 RepID=A0AAW1QY27_9CHLO
MLLEIQRRIRLEFTIEWPMLLQRWKPIFFGAAFQYVHGIFTQLASRMHVPQEVPLPDLGFSIFPALGREQEWISELIFWTMFISFALWSFSPFVVERKRFYTVVLYGRLLMVLVVCQTLRILSFTSTQLPGSNYHCRKGQATALRAWPEHWWGHLVVNVNKQLGHSCGDLIFSSHTTFALTGALTYTEYGSWRLSKVFAWVGAAAISLLIIAHRKHYSVDVVIAWYVVPLVFWTMHRRWTTKRPAVEPWPHRPLIEHTRVGGSAANMAGGVEVGSPAELAEVIVTNGSGPETSKGSMQPLLPSSNPAPSRGMSKALKDKVSAHETGEAAAFKKQAEREASQGMGRQRSTGQGGLGAINGTSPPRDQQQGDAGQGGGWAAGNSTSSMRPRAVSTQARDEEASLYREDRSPTSQMAHAQNQPGYCRVS